MECCVVKTALLALAHFAAGNQPCMTLQWRQQAALDNLGPFATAPYDVATFLDLRVERALPESWRRWMAAYEKERRWGG